MCTVFAHAAVGVVAVRLAYRRPVPARLWWLGAFCAALPDLDAGLHAYGVPYESEWGHRGMMHSFLFAAMAGSVLAWLFLRRAPGLERVALWKHAAVLSLVTASHGVLDLFTDGGLGIALFAPFSPERYFAPWNPFPVPMMGVSNLFTRYMGDVLLAEALYIGLPCTFLFAAVEIVSRRRAQGGIASSG